MAETSGLDQGFLNEFVFLNRTMALHITLENIHKLYNIDPTTKMEGLVVLHQHNNPEMEIKPNSRLFDGLLFGFLLRGTMKVQLHFLDYDIQAGDIAVLQPQLMINTKWVSHDAEIVTVGLSLDFLTRFPMIRDFIMNDQIRWQPIIRPQRDEIELQHDLIMLLERFYHKTPSRKKTEMLQHLVAALMSLIAEKHSSLPNIKTTSYNRTHEIIDNFYVLISKHAHQERRVNFYAEKMHFTPQYLSTFLKEKTGRSVSQWIDQVAILHAKALLKSSNLSVKEISNELNFGDTSLFCRYFKRVAGVSPRSYRNTE